MSEQHWLRVESIVLDAADRDIGERSAFLDEACAGNDTLRQDVESLLRFEADAEGFLQRSAMEAAAQLATVDVAFDAARLKIDGYQIGEFLGAGGMGEVYRARDLRLERDVAIKIIRRDADDRITTARFEEEARAASRLNHPNIVTVHAVGSQDDVSYIVMELVSGQTLRDLLVAGPLPQSSTLDIAAQLADGLAAAHELGVVHRDLKPENVMVTPAGLVKVLDFGIARRHVSIGGEPPAMSPSVPTFATTSAAGTAGYMSPEQAARGAIDHRSDQYSFGAIVYEMREGRRVPDGVSASGSSAGRRHPDAALDAIVERCLSATPDGRYARTRELAIAIREVRDRATHPSPRLTRRQVIAAAAVACTAVAAAVWRFPFTGGGIRRLAVLPFVNASDDKNMEILSDGITEVLILQLSNLQHLTDMTVINRNTVFRLKGMPTDPREVGRQLEVDAVLNGSVSRRGERIQVDVELVDAKTGTTIWGKPLNFPGANVVAIQNEIAAAIITMGLGIEASDATLRELSRGLSSDSEAHLLYLQALHHLRLGEETDYVEARRLLGEAVKRDGTFARAHLTLASTYSIMAIDGYESPRNAWPQSHRHVDQALGIDPDLPDAHAERAIELFFFNWDWAGSQREWDKALQSQRGEVQAELYSPYALQQWALGRNKEALRFAEAARTVDPLSPMLAMREADILAAVGDMSSAVERYTAISETVPGALDGLAQVQRKRGHYQEAIDAWRRRYAGVDDEALAAILATARGEEGYRTIDRYLAELELAVVSEREAQGLYASPLDFARAYARMGEVEPAFTFLNLAFDHQASGLVFLNVDPVWDSIRRDRRFEVAVKRVGLVPGKQRG